MSNVCIVYLNKLLLNYLFMLYVFVNVCKQGQNVTQECNQGHVCSTKFNKWPSIHEYIHQKQDI